MPKKRKIIFICASAFSIVSVVALITLHATNVLYKVAYKNYIAPTPKLNSSWSNIQQDESGDLYVSPLGDDSNDGSKEHPFLTFNKAKETVKSFDKTTRDKSTVCFLEGEYKDDELVFTEEDSGTENCQIIYKGIGEVVFNSGVYLNPSDFNNSSNYPEYTKRLSEEAKQHVKVLQLDSVPYNITKEQLNKIYPIGTYNTAYAYKDYVDGPIYSEVFINKKRMDMARYPNSGFLKTDEVLFSSRDSGVVDQNGDPKGDVYKINDDLSNRIKSWKTLDDVWMSGFFMWDWADSTTPIGSFDETTNELTTKYYSFFGARQGMPYYFFNILEELDSPGEYYFDRENMRLLIYENDDFTNSEIQISLSTKNHVRLNANYVTLDNLQFSGNRANGISSYGNNHHITIKNCSFYNLAGTAIGILGHDISIVRNDIHDVGKLGIDINGGDKNSLTYSNNVINNNYIHGYQQIYRTLGAGIYIYGVGMKISHNEITGGNLTGIHYSGIDNIIEYNNIHDTCLLGDDCGAIYGGRSWTSYGNIIQNNIIYNLGSVGHQPHGIYMDDAYSGQTIRNNLLINVPGFSIICGGGRDMVVKNNYIVNSGREPIFYDARAREGALTDMWFSSHVNKDGDMWVDLFDSPYQSETWQNKFPQYKDFVIDFNDYDNPNFVPNPANSDVTNNIVFDKELRLGDINKYVYLFSNVSNNEILKLNKLTKYFSDYKNGNYSLKNGDGYSYNFGLY